MAKRKDCTLGVRRVAGMAISFGEEGSYEKKARREVFAQKRRPTENSGSREGSPGGLRQGSHCEQERESWDASAETLLEWEPLSPQRKFAGRRTASECDFSPHFCRLRLVDFSVKSSITERLQLGYVLRSVDVFGGHNFVKLARGRVAESKELWSEKQFDVLQFSMRMHCWNAGSYLTLFASLVRLDLTEPLSWLHGKAMTCGCCIRVLRGGRKKPVAKGVV